MLSLQLPHLGVRRGGGARVSAGGAAAHPLVLLPSLAQGTEVHALVQGGRDAVHRGASCGHRRCLVREILIMVLLLDFLYFL